jgi:acetyl-CoA acyltransferase
VNPKMPADWTLSLGESTELLGEKYGIDRADADAFAVRSQTRAAQAWATGAYESAVVQVPGAELERDEGIRDGVTTESLAKLKPSFREDGTVTAGNASQLSDGAAALLLADADRARELGLRPRARILAQALVGAETYYHLDGPVQATERVLTRTGMTMADIDLFEVNEAFAPVVLAWAADTGADLGKTNVNGGAIAIGHPLGASGARIMTTLVNALEQSGGRYGLQTMCEGGGMANATIIERL